MSGINYLFDTNAVLYFLNLPRKLHDGSVVFISFVTGVRLLKKLTPFKIS